MSFAQGYQVATLMFSDSCYSLEWRFPVFALMGGVLVGSSDTERGNLCAISVSNGRADEKTLDAERLGASWDDG